MEDEFVQGQNENHFLNQEHQNKEMDTRITYQYPKGKFRFPIIPDEVKVHERRQPKQSERVVMEEKKRETSPPLKKQPLPKVHSTAPFRPTEIPSPIFGFQRPKNSSEAIEHELSNFSQPLASQTPLTVQRKEEREIMEEPIKQINAGVFSAEMDIGDPGNEESAIVAEKTVKNEELYPAEETAGVTENKQNVSEELSEPKKQTRQHLPFNVMMLKSDKRKWEDKKKHSMLSENMAVQQTAAAKETIKEERQSRPVQQMIEKREENIPVHSNLLPQQDHLNEPILKTVIQVEETKDCYQFPGIDLLHSPVVETMDQEWVKMQTNLLNETLQNFNVGANVVNVTQGPSVTRFEVQPEPGVKVNKVTNLTDDIKLSLAARDIRIEAPIPGKHTIGIEVPNQKSRPVLIREIIQSEIFRQSPSPLTAVLGLDISGKPIVTDLKKMPHGLIAGATGSGKSVCINSILTSLLYKASPDDVKLLLIDPKMVELAPYNRIPHLVSPVITDVKAATAALKWAVEEMERRYELFAHTGVRDITRFNELAVEHKRYADKFPFIVIIIDELADLMMMSPADVEEAICRIAQKARACGIHLIIATQRPSVDVITGLIKANVPTRIAFSVSSQIDSRTIIDIGGAEKLLGRGDMLFLENGSSKPVRLQGTFVSDEEIDTVVAHVRDEREPEYLFEQEELLKKARISDEEDELFYEACAFVVEQGGASTSSLQRHFKIGYNRAARLMDLMEQEGFIAGANGSKPREVYITLTDLESIQEAN